jgi:hypothetical protein
VEALVKFDPLMVMVCGEEEATYEGKETEAIVEVIVGLTIVIFRITAGAAL